MYGMNAGPGIFSPNMMLMQSASVESSDGEENNDEILLKIWSVYDSY